ncbi:hypothetical protein [Nocardia sp.]|uniref:hypothetical protein n=1 Tax=Nocardia sp. TaxID=1821 RepID=UPI00260E9DEE|nr:hypothetical protein [Nocardia sp.]
MAICFELVVNFGDNIDAARSAVLSQAVSWRTTLDAGNRSIPLHTPLLRTDGPYVELSVLPVAVGLGVALDGDIPQFALTAAELTELGHQLYQLLATFDGYVAATVGWDPEVKINPNWLKGGWIAGVGAGAADGLVLCDALHAELGWGDEFAVFRPGYRWMPYRGETASTIYTD